MTEKPSMAKLKEVFDVFDQDKSGSISTLEIMDMIKICNLTDHATEIQTLINNSGHSGDINFETFVDIFGFNEKAASENSVERIFELFDPKGQGSFGSKQFEKVAQSVGENISAAEIEQMIDFADKNRDGKIDYEEYLNIISKKYPKV